MRAHVVPPYPSFTYVMSQIGGSSQESQAAPQRRGNPSAKSVPRPYSKHDDNPFMRTVRYDYYESARGSDPTSTTHPSRGHPGHYPPRSKPPMSLPLVGKFLQKHASVLSQRKKVASAV